MLILNINWLKNYANYEFNTEARFWHTSVGEWSGADGDKSSLLPDLKM